MPECSSWLLSQRRTPTAEWLHPGFFVRYAARGIGTSSTYRGSARPLLDFQPRNAAKLALVVGDQNEFRRPGMCGKPQVFVADHLSLGLQDSADCPIELAGARRERHYRQQTRQLGQLPAGLFTKLAFFL